MSNSQKLIGYFIVVFGLSITGAIVWHFGLVVALFFAASLAISVWQYDTNREETEQQKATTAYRRDALVTAAKIQHAHSKDGYGYAFNMPDEPDTVVFGYKQDRIEVWEVIPDDALDYAVYGLSSERESVFELDTSYQLTKYVYDLTGKAAQP